MVGVSPNIPYSLEEQITQFFILLVYNKDNLSNGSKV